MSLFFAYSFSVFLPLFCIVGLSYLDSRRIFQDFFLLFLGFLFGYCFVVIASQTQQIDFIDILGNLTLVITLSGILILSSIRRFSHFLKIFIFLLALSFGIYFFLFLQDFPIFTQDFLNNESLLSLFFLILGFLVALGIFFFVREKFLGSKIKLFALYVITILELQRALGNLLLVGMHQDIVPDSDILLSFIAKSRYFSNYAIYFVLMVIVLFIFYALFCAKPKKTKKHHCLDIAYRNNEAYRHRIDFASLSTLFLSCIAAGILSFFHLIQSRPLSIDEPIEVFPNENAEFVFKMQTLRDQNLHRYAYVTPEGKIVRFFLINRREDRDSPVAVFDACNLCGDVGYIKKGGELICVACNVRIFLPSVGKAGGCNPIPLPYKFDLEEIAIKASDVINGSRYFSAIKEIEVIDPVSGEKVLNSTALFSYTFRGINYYFVNEENYDAFKNDPLKYVGWQ